MGKILRNSIAYTGTSNVAGNISYDNSQSQLRSTTVQNAITELSNSVINGLRQVTELPTASSTEVGNIYQYIGETSGNLTHGYVYECQSSGDPATYSWIVLPTFEAGEVEGGVGRTEKDQSDEPLGEYFNLYEDYTDPVTEVVTPRNTALGKFSHAEGKGTHSGGEGSHAEGFSNKIFGPYGVYSHVEGQLNNIDGPFVHGEGTENFYGQFKLNDTPISGINIGSGELPTASQADATKNYIKKNTTTDTYEAWHIINSSTTPEWELLGTLTMVTSSGFSHVEGYQNIVSALYAHVEGGLNTVEGGANYSHVEGIQHFLEGGTYQAHAEGSNNTFLGGASNGHAEGVNNTIGQGTQNSHVEGSGNDVGMGNSQMHLEGTNNSVTSGGNNTVHVEGTNNTSTWTNTSVHIEGQNNIANGVNTAMHIEGQGNTNNGFNTNIHIEGSDSQVGSYNDNVHVEGLGHIIPSWKPLTGTVYFGGHIEGAKHRFNFTTATSEYFAPYGLHIEGNQNTIQDRNWNGDIDSSSGPDYGRAGHAEGHSNYLGGIACHVEGQGNYAFWNGSHVEGTYNKAEGNGSHAEGGSNTSYGHWSHVEGRQNNIPLDANQHTYDTQHPFAVHIEGGVNSSGADYSHVEGNNNKIWGGRYDGACAHIEGQYNNIGNSGTAAKVCSHVEGVNNTSFARCDHIEGEYNTTTETAGNAHVEGSNNTAQGNRSHVEGQNNTTRGSISHAEGFNNETGSTQSPNQYQHVEGYLNKAIGTASHAQGTYNTANGENSHAGGFHTFADAKDSTVIGKYNVADNTMSNDLIDTTTLDDNTYMNTTTSIDDPGYYWYVDDLSCDFSMTDYIYVKDSEIIEVKGHATHGDRNKDFIEVIFYDEEKTPIMKNYLEAEESNELLTWKLANTNHPTYIRFAAKLSGDELADAYVKISKPAHLFIVGNGTADNHRSNIFEVGQDSININGDIYQNGELFTGGVPHFVGTTAEWTALTAEEKAAYTGGDVVLTDDNSGIIDSTVTKNSPNPVTSAGIYAALAEITTPNPYISTNGFYYARKYYDNRQVVHYRRHFGTTTFPINTTKKIDLGNYDGLPSTFSTVLEAAFSSNMYVINAIVFKDDKTAGQNLLIGSLDKEVEDDNTSYYAYITATGAQDYSNGFTVDITIDTF